MEQRRRNKEKESERKKYREKVRVYSGGGRERIEANEVIFLINFSTLFLCKASWPGLAVKLIKTAD